MFAIFSFFSEFFPATSEKTDRNSIIVMNATGTDGNSGMLFWP